MILPYDYDVQFTSDKINFVLIYLPSNQIILHINPCNIIDNNAAAMEFYKKVVSYMEVNTYGKRKRMFVYVDSDEDMKIHKSDSFITISENEEGYTFKTVCEDGNFKFNKDHKVYMASGVRSYYAVATEDNNLTVVIKSYYGQNLKAAIDKMCEQISVPSYQIRHIKEMFDKYYDIIGFDGAHTLGGRIKFLSSIVEEENENKFNSALFCDIMDMCQSMANHMFKELVLPDWIDKGLFVYLATNPDIIEKFVENNRRTEQ